MALIINGDATATAMSPIVRGILDKEDNLFVPGVSYTDEYDVGSAGQIEIPRMNIKNVGVSTPGADFVDDDTVEAYTQLNINNAFQYSKKIKAFAASAVPYDKVAAYTGVSTRSVQKARDNAVIGKLISEAAPSKSTVANPNIVTGDYTKATIQDILLGLQGKLAQENLLGDVALLSPAAYQLFKESLGQYYTPTYNDEVVRTGEATRWMGMYIASTGSLGTTGTFEFKDAEGNKVQISSIKGNGLKAEVTFDKLQAIVYDHRVLAIIDRLDTLRVIDSETFNGSKLQEELVTGIAIVSENKNEFGAKQGIALGLSA